MKAMILAAGEGRRMLPLTATTPKPLLPLGETTLIGYHLQRLAAAGFQEVVINLAYLGAQIQQALGDGTTYGLNIEYSLEPCPLETGGGIYQALSLLGQEPFVLINGDVFTDFPLAQLRRPLTGLGHLILVPNPEQHPQGDFALTDTGALQLRSPASAYTYSGISLLNPALVADFPLKRPKFPLVEAFNWAIEQTALSGELYSGCWLDVGTPERLEACRLLYQQQKAPCN